MQATIEKLEAKVSELKQLEVIADKTEQLETTISEKNKEIQDLEEKITALEKENSSLSGQVASPSSNAKSDSSSSDETVYVTNTGSKYHVSGCQYLSASKMSISLSSAKSSYSPCSRCHPPT